MNEFTELFLTSFNVILFAANVWTIIFMVAKARSNHYERSMLDNYRRVLNIHIDKQSNIGTREWCQSRLDEIKMGVSVGVAVSLTIDGGAVVEVLTPSDDIGQVDR